MSNAIDKLKETKVAVHDLIGSFNLGETRASLAIAEYYLGQAIELSNEDIHGRGNNG